MRSLPKIYFLSRLPQYSRKEKAMIRIYRLYGKTVNQVTILTGASTATISRYVKNAAINDIIEDWDYVDAEFYRKYPPLVRAPARHISRCFLKMSSGYR